jgi:hypothetical protein
LPWQQGVDFVDWMAFGNFSENISEIIFGVHVVLFCCLDEGVDGGGAVTACVGAGEELIFAAYGDAAHGVFGDVVVDLYSFSV